MNANGPSSPFAPAVVTSSLTTSVVPAVTTRQRSVASTAVPTPVTVTCGPATVAPSAGVVMAFAPGVSVPGSALASAAGLGDSLAGDGVGVELAPVEGDDDVVPPGSSTPAQPAIPSPTASASMSAAGDLARRVIGPG